MTQDDILRDLQSTIDKWEPSWDQRRHSADVDYSIRVDLANSSQVSSIAEAERIRQDSYHNVEVKREEKITKLVNSAEKRLIALAQSEGKTYDPAPLKKLTENYL